MSTVYLRCNRTQRQYKIVGQREPEPGKIEIQLEGANGKFWEPRRSVAEFEEIGYTRVIVPEESASA